MIYNFWKFIILPVNIGTMTIASWDHNVAAMVIVGPVILLGLLLIDVDMNKQP